MQLIPAGNIQMRDDRIQKVWTVEIPAFYLAPYPVSQALYESITQHNPSTFRGDNLPVETVSWVDAVRFCNLLSQQEGLEPCYALAEDQQKVSFDPQAGGYRLPTEAEWQYACKAGTSDIRYGNLEEIAWYKENSGGKTHPLGQKQANPWGLYDMLGNVWEWCADIYDETVYGSYRVLRGGGWADEARSVMATTRRRSHPSSFKIDDLGFRIARNAD